MAYTTHGHQIPGSPTPLTVEPRTVVRCGGPVLCSECNVEASSWQAKHLDVPLIDEKTPSGILRYFSYSHLPADLAAVSSHFFVVAQQMDQSLPDGAEKSVTLRKLLEAKDAAVRSALDLRTT